MNWNITSTLTILVLIGLTKACNKEDCETGLSVASGTTSACAAVGGIFCAVTFGAGCIVSGVCGAAAGLSEASKEVCRGCGANGGGNGEFTSNDRQTLQELLCRSENSFYHQDRENLQEILDRAVEGYNSEDRELLQEVLMLTKEGFNNEDRRIVQELLARAKLDTVTLGEIQKQVQDIPRKINELKEQIDLSMITSLYGDDFTNYYQTRTYFSHLNKNSRHMIENDRHAERFFRQAHDTKDIYIIATNIHRMVTGGHFLKSEGLFEAVPGLCNSVNYILAVMADCFIMYNTALAMKGWEIQPAKMDTFKNNLIEVQNQHIKDCGCPSEMFQKTRHNLAAMVQFETARKPAAQFYHQIIMDPSIDKTTLKKMSLVYITKPFDNTEEAKETMSNTDIENAQLVYTLGKEHLDDLHRYEGSLYCRTRTAGSLMAIGGYNGTHDISSVEVLSTVLPKTRHAHISVTTADGNILVCGGLTPSGPTASCLKFNSRSKTWEHHSSLKSSYRYYSSAIAFNHGIYVLGGLDRSSSEFLATGSSEWIPGPTIPGGGVDESCAAKLSDTEFVILGGWHGPTQALVYNTTRNEWREWPNLRNEVQGQSCVTLGNKILMAGGWSGGYTGRTVIFDTKSGSAREVASLKYPRVYAAMEIYRGRAVILGGRDGSGRYRSDGEVWNMDTETWEEADIHLNIARSEFSLVATDDNICE